MGNSNTDNKTMEFSSEQVLEFELVLIKAINTFYELPNLREAKGNSKDYLINFCYDRNYPVKDTFEFIRPLIKKDIELEFKDIVPESKKGQEFLIRGNLAGMLNRSGAVWNEKETDEMVDRFCSITGISKDFALPHINTFIKQRKRQVIETELVAFLQKHVAKITDKQERKERGDYIIGEFAEILNVEPKYIKGVLKDKRRKDEAERKRLEEYRREMKKSLPANPDGNESR